jgi:hypothetical protein
VVGARNRGRPPSLPVRHRPGRRRAPGSPGRREPDPSSPAHRRPAPDPDHFPYHPPVTAWMSRLRSSAVKSLISRGRYGRKRPFLVFTQWKSKAQSLQRPCQSHGQPGGGRLLPCRRRRAPGLRRQQRASSAVNSWGCFYRAIRSISVVSVERFMATTYTASGTIANGCSTKELEREPGEQPRRADAPAASSDLTVMWSI